MFWISIPSRHKLGGAVIANLWTPPTQAMLKATEIIRTVHKLSNMTTLHGGGGGGRYFVLSFGNCPNIFGQDCSLRVHNPDYTTL